jgi:hypothetical protein
MLYFHKLPYVILYYTTQSGTTVQEGYQGTMSCEDKVQLKGRIEEGTVKRFKELVIAKYGKLDGFLSYELGVAIKQYIASYKVANTVCTRTQIQQTSTAQTGKTNPSPKTLNVYHQIKDYPRNSVLYEDELPHFIPEKHLREAVNALRGTDKRTYAKWYSDFVSYGCIKRNGPGQIEML